MWVGSSFRRCNRRLRRISGTFANRADCFVHSKRRFLHSIRCVRLGSSQLHKNRRKCAETSLQRTRADMIMYKCWNYLKSVGCETATVEKSFDSTGLEFPLCRFHTFTRSEPRSRAFQADGWHSAASSCHNNKYCRCHLHDHSLRECSRNHFENALPQQPRGMRTFASRLIIAAELSLVHTSSDRRQGQAQR